MIPYIWKIAIVIQQQEKYLICLKSNNKPVSLTCVWCKNFQKLIRNHILNIMEGRYRF